MRTDWFISSDWAVRHADHTAQALVHPEGGAVAVLAAFGTADEASAPLAAASAAIATTWRDPSQEGDPSLAALLAAEASFRRAELAATAVAARLQGDQLSLAWSGQCRAYLWRYGIFHQVTEDHTPQNEPDAEVVVDLSAGESVTRALGLPAELGIAPDVGLRTLHGGDVLLFCSPALPRRLERDALKSLIDDAPLEQVAARIGAAAHEEGTPDPLLVLLRLHEEA